jgi:hypothetical protein
MQLLTSHETVEWYSPPWFIERVRKFLGRIDLDPASCITAQRWIKAGEFFTERQNGLEQEWGSPEYTTQVYLNPPYSKTAGKSNAERWVQKLDEEYAAGRVTEAILLVNSTHGYAWFESLWRKRTCCFPRERFRFVNELGQTGDQAKRGQCVAYYGTRHLAFRQEFQDLGRVILADDR